MLLNRKEKLIRCYFLSFSRSWPSCARINVLICWRKHVVLKHIVIPFILHRVYSLLVAIENQLIDQLVLLHLLLILIPRGFGFCKNLFAAKSLAVFDWFHASLAFFWWFTSCFSDFNFLFCRLNLFLGHFCVVSAGIIIINLNLSLLKVLNAYLRWLRLRMLSRNLQKKLILRFLFNAVLALLSFHDLHSVHLLLFHYDFAADYGYVCFYIYRGLKVRFIRTWSSCHFPAMLFGFFIWLRNIASYLRLHRFEIVVKTLHVTLVKQIFDINFLLVLWLRLL